jgi:signal-transduction protein with cAMP-binding, CBS, and nucleotidyltransferase domain
MTREYSPLPLAPLASAARVAELPLPHVTLDDAALEVMTDLKQVPAATTTPDEPIVEANRVMMRRGVRLLFVIDADGSVQGVITATDLLGEKPVRFMQERGIAHSEIRVSDIMTPASMLEAIDVQDIASMRVGHVVATMRAVRRQHLMVSEEGGRRIRGLFSATRIARQLGVELNTTEVARTFADIEAALAR